MNGTALVLGRAQKAAAVLVAVGPQLSSKVLEHLSEEEVEQVALEVAQLGDVPPLQLESILTEFRAEAEAHAALLSGGEHHAREMLRSRYGEEADEIVDRLLASSQSAPFHFLRMHEPAEILQHLREESPQTIAVVLAHLPARLGATLLGGFDPQVQVSVASRLATLERADADVVRRIEESFRSRLGEVRRRSGRRDGVKELADLLNQSDRATERAIMSELETTDPALAERVRALMFVFEDLITLQDRALQELLRQVEPAQLATALKGVSTELQEALLRNLSERARTSVAEEMDLMGQVRLKDVEAAQTNVVRLVYELEKEGVITMSRGQEEFVG
ncbi:flagellar motor switch protein FliG [Egicoccus halophilus]|uniref:Flagellar motor switch protein FliG n=1 Tax=Egicoccus halophilus TaxID=1670830 RepID=A0A8J3AAQ7_9ACTN|nr:flagellar motor switch protein FliG [Egicoccus halophilus]GGI06691.1 flagellar motor switch protein FliG [Egicoccus halophilus]